MIKDVSETIQNQAKEQRSRFLGMLLFTLGASFSGNLLTKKGVKRPNSCSISGRGVIRAGERNN